jgi:hypothetical protein
VPVGLRIAAAGEATFALPSAAPAESPVEATGIRKKKNLKSQCPSTITVYKVEDF